MRDVYPAGAGGAAHRDRPAQTPFGLAFTSDGALWIADLGIVVAQPAPGPGLGDPGRDGGTARRETVRDGLTFPDGLGVYRP